MSQDRTKNLEERTRKRNAYMTAIYELYDESGDTWIGRPDISERAELSHEDTIQAENYWEGLGLVKTQTMGPDGDIEITPHGIETVENSIKIAAQEQAELERGAAPSTSSPTIPPTWTSSFSTPPLTRKSRALSPSFCAPPSTWRPTASAAPA